MGRIDRLLVVAIAESERLEIGDVFLLQDLFRDEAWTALPLREQISLEKLFSSYVESEGLHLKMAGESDEGCQIYQVVRG